MKQLFIIIILFSTPQLLAQRSLVANPKNNFIYNGVYTPIQVMLPICDYDSLSVTASHGDFKKILKGYYAWTVCEATKVPLFIYIKAYRNGQQVYQDQSEFFLKFVPNPTPILSCGMRTITQKHISECSGMVAIFKDFAYEAHCKIQEFTIIHIRDGVTVKEWENTSGTFENRTREQLKNAKKDDIIVFSDIIAKCDCDACDAIARIIPSFEIRVQS